MHSEQQILIEAGSAEWKYGYQQQYIAPIDGKYWAFWVRYDMTNGYAVIAFPELGFDADEVVPVDAHVTAWVPVEELQPKENGIE